MDMQQKQAAAIQIALDHFIKIKGYSTPAAIHHIANSAINKINATLKKGRK